MNGGAPGDVRLMLTNRAIAGGAPGGELPNTGRCLPVAWPLPARSLTPPPLHIGCVYKRWSRWFDLSFPQ